LGGSVRLFVSYHSFQSVHQLQPYDRPQNKKNKKTKKGKKKQDTHNGRDPKMAMNTTEYLSESLDGKRMTVVAYAIWKAHGVVVQGVLDIVVE
jgi:hypothetical protein